MTRRLPGPDTRPWFRQFWPWFLILLPATVVVAGLTTVYIASEHADDLVVDEYYEDGLAINRELAKIGRASQSGLSATLYIEGDGVSVATSVALPDEHLQLQLSHPLEADRDFSVTLTRVSAQTYAGKLAHEITPHWHWVLEGAGNSDWRLDGTLGTADFAHAVGG